MGKFCEIQNHMHTLLKKRGKNYNRETVEYKTKINRQYVGSSSGEEIYALFSNKNTTIWHPISNLFAS